MSLKHKLGSIPASFACPVFELLCFACLLLRKTSRPFEVMKTQAGLNVNIYMYYISLVIRGFVV